VIVGNGTLAQAFIDSDQNWDEYIILASGVSNSLEVREESYQREKDLINSFLGEKRTVVYFSTASIYDPQKSTSIYVQFKKEIEDYILQSFAKSIVLRLPIVLGTHNNPNQLLGYIRSCLAQDKELTIYKYATRYFFDVRDVPKATLQIAENMQHLGLRTKAINVGFQNQITMAEVAGIIAEKFPKAKINLVEKGDSYLVDFSDFEHLVSTKDYISSDAIQLVKKYL
jgi:nucleoside-diphosphate-sugar epimerase